MMPEFITNLSLIWLILIITLFVLITVMKAISLYISANKGQKVWFVFLFIFSSGILHLIYLIIRPGSRRRK